MNHSQLTVYGPTLRQLVHQSLKSKKWRLRRIEPQKTTPFSIEFCSEPVTMVQGTVYIGKKQNIIVIHEMDGRPCHIVSQKGILHIKTHKLDIRDLQD